MFRTLTVLAVCTGLLLPEFMAGHALAAEYRDGIAAVVSDEVITVYEVAQESRQLEAAMASAYTGEELRAKRAQLREDIAKQLIERTLVYKEFKNRGYSVPPEFVEKQMDQVVVQRAGGDWDVFERALLAQGMTLGEYRERLEKRLAVEILLNDVVRGKVEVTPREISEYYNSHKEAFTRPARVRLGIIFVRAKGRSENELDSRAREIGETLEMGADFADVARSFSEDVSAEKGGDVGWIETASSRQDFVAVAGSLKPDDVGRPLKTPEGVYFIKLLDTEKPELLPLNENVSRQIKARLQREKQAGRYEAFMSKLRRKYYVKSFF